MIGGEYRRKMNRSLGIFQLTGIPRAMRGVPQIEVEFAIDANGILKCQATDKDSGHSQKIVISGGVGLDKNEIERMKRVTVECDERAEIKFEMADMRNHAESVLHDVTKWIEFNNKFMLPGSTDQVMKALKRLEKKLQKGDKYALRAALKKLDEIMQPLRYTG